MPPHPAGDAPVVLRFFHAARDPDHRARDRALAALGVRVVLVVPDRWPGGGDTGTAEPFEVVELPVLRPGNVNNHRFRDPDALRRVLDRVRPDLVDVQAEPFGAVTHQVLSVLDAGQTVVGYTAQNIDKRFPPPFAGWERAALRRLDGLYPCSRQAASVARGKGFAGPVRVLPYGVEPTTMHAGGQRHDDDVFVLGLAGRLVPEKGLAAAVRALAVSHRVRPSRLEVVGEGPEAATAQALARELGVADRLDLIGWTDAAGIAARYRSWHVTLVPSRATETWVEQFGRVVGEAHACGSVVAAAASGSLPEVVGAEGVLTPEYDDAAFAAAVGDLAADAGRWTTLRSAGLGRTVTWDALARDQLAFYETALAGTAPTAAVGRAAATAEFGAPARIGGNPRPFALPVLRRDVPATRALGAVVDVGVGALDRVRGRR
ncbi:glycosyltransferase family 4 protein [Jatrophihabitans sp. YIM 134969]